MIKYEKLNFKKENVWLMSDPHFHHKNICKGVSEWKDSPSRDFKDEIEMTNIIIDNINKCVKEDDLLICLGDWSFNGIDKVSLSRTRIKCKNIFLVFGNHDQNIINNSVCPVEIPRHLLQVYFTRCGHVMYLEVDNIRMFLSHYPHYVWHQGHHNVFHFYGHCHSSIEEQVKGKMMDVGVDNAFKLLGEYKPFNLKELEIIMEGKEKFCPDHHQENTN